MATLYTAQQQLTKNNPPESVRTQDSHGRVRVQSWSWTATAAVASTDQVQLCVLPAGSRVIQGRISAEATLQSAAGVIVIGTTATTNKYLTSTSSFSAATAAAYFADTAAQNYLNNDGTAASQLSAQETVVLSFQTAGCTAGVAVYGDILYIVD
jgi:hypothetical protein